MYTIYIYVANKILTAKFVTPSSIVELMADNVEKGHSGFDQTPLKRFQALFKSLNAQLQIPQQVQCIFSTCAAARFSCLLMNNAV